MREIRSRNIDSPATVLMMEDLKQDGEACLYSEPRNAVVCTTSGRYLGQFVTLWNYTCERDGLNPHLCRLCFGGNDSKTTLASHIAGLEEREVSWINIYKSPQAPSALHEFHASAAHGKPISH